MQSTTMLVNDDPYLKLPASERIAARRDRKAKLFKRVAFNVAPSMTDPPVVPVIEPVPASDQWIERQRQIPLPASPFKAFITVLDIQIITAKYYGLKLADILSRSRQHKHVKPRQVGMYLAREFTGKSTLKIGRFFGGRDHATAYYAIEKIERLAASDPVLAQEIATIRAALIGEQV
jgi:hypothetical protein